VGAPVPRRSGPRLATIFASAYGLIWQLSPDAFVNLLATEGDSKEVAVMLYFSLTTPTATGYGDIVAVDPFARSLANLEAVIGQFFLAITVARLVTLELADRRRCLSHLIRAQSEKGLELRRDDMSKRTLRC
jgi:hypothetical protein